MSINSLVDFIVRAENGGRLNWDSVYGGIKQSLRPDGTVSRMAVGDVVAWQRSVRGKVASTAIGGPQFIASTLAGLVNRGVCEMTDTFNETTQRNLAIALMRGRGLDRYLAGTIGVAAFANELAKEWASLPVVSGPKAGRSYYDGDGLNHSQVKVADFLAAVVDCKSWAPPAAKPAPALTLWQRLLHLIGV